jgi:hypothetical protein
VREVREAALRLLAAQALGSTIRVSVGHVLQPRWRSGETYGLIGRACIR